MHDSRTPMFASLRHLPRDARDTLFVLAVIAWTILPHAAHLAPWCIALAGIILVVRARLAVVGGALPSRWTLAAVLALAVGLTLASESTLLGKEAGVTMLVVLMALNSFGIVPDAVRELMSGASRWLLVTAIAALGARVIDPVNEDLAAVIAEMTGGEGVAVAVDAAGVQPAFDFAKSN